MALKLEELHQLPLREKLFILEAIWDDIAQAEEQLELPAWHKELLDEREQKVAQGKAQFLDWDKAKRQIDEAIVTSPGTI